MVGEARILYRRGWSGSLLTRFLREVLCGRGRSLIACVGTELRGDDAAGLIVYRALSRRARERAILCEYGLENCITALEGSGFDTILVVDGVVAEEPPGSIVLADTSCVDNSFLATTHNMPLSAVLKYLRLSGFRGQLLILGIVVRKLGIGDSVSPEVMEASLLLAKKISEVLGECPS